jgi:hypothetical protein
VSRQPTRRVLGRPGTRVEVRWPVGHPGRFRLGVARLHGAPPNAGGGSSPPASPDIATATAGADHPARAVVGGIGANGESRTSICSARRLASLKPDACAMICRQATINAMFAWGHALGSAHRDAAKLTSCCIGFTSPSSTKMNPGTQTAPPNRGDYAPNAGGVRACRRR